LGLGVAWAALRMTNYYLAKMLPQSLPASLDWRVLGFAVALTAVIGLIIGLIPVIHIMRTNLAAVIQSSSRSVSSNRGVRALSGVLVVAQVAVALILLAGAGLLIQSFAQALRVDTGLEPGKVVTARIALTREHRSSDEAANKIRERLLQAMRQIPGVLRGACLFHTVPGRAADQRVHPGERYAAAGRPAAGRLPRDRDAWIPRNVGAETGGRPLL